MTVLHHPFTPAALVGVTAQWGETVQGEVVTDQYGREWFVAKDGDRLTVYHYGNNRIPGHHGGIMTFIIGLLCGLILGTTLSVFAQLAPFDAPLKEQLNGQRQEQYLSLERELERREHQSQDPCRY